MHLPARLSVNPARAARALLALIVAACAAAPALAQTRTLVLSTYGLNNDLFKKHVYEPFEARCGCRIVLETGLANDRLAKLEARRNNPNVDLVQVTDFLALEASQKGLLQPIDRRQLKNLDQIYDFARDPLRNGEAVAYTLYSVGLVVRTDKPSATIASWKDLWRPDLKGRLLLANITGNQGLAQLFMADRTWGGMNTDMSTGMARIGEIKANAVTFYAQTAQMTSLFAQDEAWVAPVGRFAWLNLQKTGKPLKWVVPREGQVGMMNTISIVKGSRNADLAHQLLDFWLSKDVQTALANDLADSPVNRNARPKPEAAEALTWGQAQIDSLVFMKPEMVVRERAGWITAWNRMVAK
jgi:putative spermidine/putrescine transport system substrate-binding protein